MNNSRILQRSAHLVLIVIALLILSACRGGSDDNDGPNLDWELNIFEPAEEFAEICGSVAEGFWLRSIFNEFYFWYRDIIDTDPNNFFNVGDHFDYLVSDEITSSGKLKDEFSFFTNADTFEQAIEEGVEIGYGLRLVIDETSGGTITRITVAYVAENSPADNAGIGRGDEITAIDGTQISNLNRNEILIPLFPSNSGQQHRFQIGALGGGFTEAIMTSEEVSMPATANAKIIDPAGDNIGYLQFNDHTEVAETELINAFTMFESGGIDDLVLDLRYNPGGLLSIASQVSYMIAGSAATNNKVFERLVFNDRFFSEALNFITTGGANNNPLPTLALSRVVVITGQDTCSASESIINSLRGVGVEVILIGHTTCGKPFGFRAFENCGLAFLPVLFQGENDIGFGDYADGFAAQNSSDSFAELIPGCAVADDFNEPMGDESEARLAAALNYLATTGCPAATVVTRSTALFDGTATGAQIPTSCLKSRGIKIF